MNFDNVFTQVIATCFRHSIKFPLVHLQSFFPPLILKAWICLYINIYYILYTGLYHFVLSNIDRLITLWLLPWKHLYNVTLL